MKNIILFTVLLFILNSKALSAFRTLEADYITNVNAPTNYIKNPNARVNVSGAGVSNGVLTRTTVDPLVESSSFLLTTTLASTTSSVTLLARPLDKGLLGKQCLASFYYKTTGTINNFLVNVKNGQTNIGGRYIEPSTSPVFQQIPITCPTTDNGLSLVINVGKPANQAVTLTFGGVFFGDAKRQQAEGTLSFPKKGEVGSFYFVENSVTLGANASTNFLVATYNNFTQQEASGVWEVRATCSATNPMQSLSVAVSAVSAFEYDMIFSATTTSNGLTMYPNYVGYSEVSATNTKRVVAIPIFTDNQNETHGGWCQGQAGASGATVTVRTEYLRIN